MKSQEKRKKIKKSGLDAGVQPTFFIIITRFVFGLG